MEAALILIFFCVIFSLWIIWDFISLNVHWKGKARIFLRFWLLPVWGAFVGVNVGHQVLGDGVGGVFKGFTAFTFGFVLVNMMITTAQLREFTPAQIRECLLHDEKNR